MLKGVERLTLTIFPFFKLVIAPSLSFSRWSRTLVELNQIRTEESAKEGQCGRKPDAGEGGKGVLTRAPLDLGRTHTCSFLEREKGGVERVHSQVAWAGPSRRCNKKKNY